MVSRRELSQPLIEHAEFDRNSRPFRQDDQIYRYCSFTDLNIEGFGVSGPLIGCVLQGVDWYWGLFNTAMVSRTTFKNCTFRGTSFMGCRFIECEFEDCRFQLSNLGGPCRFEGCILVDCRLDRCEFVLENPHARPVFTDTRWHGCTRTRCTGLEGQF